MRNNKVVLALPLLALSALWGYPADSGSLPHSESAFLKDAAEGGIAEVKLGELAQQNGANEHVKNFGKRMADDHSKLGEEVRALASKRDVVLPTDMSVKERLNYKLLSSKTGAEFDRQYVSAMVKDHQNDIAAFEKEANSGKDADVKALAAQALPTLHKHLQMIQAIAAEIGVSK